MTGMWAIAEEAFSQRAYEHVFDAELAAFCGDDTPASPEHCAEALRPLVTASTIIRARLLDIDETIVEDLVRLARIEDTIRRPIIVNRRTLAEYTKPERTKPLVDIDVAIYRLTPAWATADLAPEVVWPEQPPENVHPDVKTHLWRFLFLLYRREVTAS